MEDPFLQTRLLLHVNVGLAEDQIPGTAGPSHCAGNALPEQYHALARPLPKIVERVYQFVKIRRIGGAKGILWGAEDPPTGVCCEFLADAGPADSQLNTYVTRTAAPVS